MGSQISVVRSKIGLDNCIWNYSLHLYVQITPIGPFHLLPSQPTKTTFLTRDNHAVEDPNRENRSKTLLYIYMYTLWWPWWSFMEFRNIWLTASSSTSSSWFMPPPFLASSPNSSFFANLPRTLGRLSASVFRQAYCKIIV